jgi:hypothetical protein
VIAGAAMISKAASESVPTISGLNNFTSADGTWLTTIVAIVVLATLLHASATVLAGSRNNQSAAVENVEDTAPAPSSLQLGARLSSSTSSEGASASPSPRLAETLRQLPQDDIPEASPREDATTSIGDPSNQAPSLRMKAEQGLSFPDAESAEEYHHATYDRSVTKIYELGDGCAIAIGPDSWNCLPPSPNVGSSPWSTDSSGASTLVSATPSPTAPSSQALGITTPQPITATESDELPVNLSPDTAALVLASARETRDLERALRVSCTFTPTLDDDELQRGLALSRGSYDPLGRATAAARASFPGTAELVPAGSFTPPPSNLRLRTTDPERLEHSPSASLNLDSPSDDLDLVRAMHESKLLSEQSPVQGPSLDTTPVRLELERVMLESKLLSEEPSPPSLDTTPVKEALAAAALASVASEALLQQQRAKCDTDLASAVRDSLDRQLE